MAIARPKRKTAYAKRKAADQREHKAYVAWLHQQPCVVCSSRYQIEAAHVGNRAFGQKCSDAETISLCAEHHRTGTTAHHFLGKRFWAFHGIDRDAILAELHARFDTKQKVAA